MTDSQLIESIRIVPDFPVKGIQFFDVTTLFKNPAAYREVLDRICDIYKGKGITKVAGIESRGFMAGAAVASRLGAGFVPIRKPGKLPARVVSEKYSKEYREGCRRIAEERARFIKELSGIKFLKPYPSDANYVLCKVGKPYDSESLSVALWTEAECLVKDCSSKKGFNGASFIRLAVKSKEDDDVLLGALKKLNIS